MATTKVGRFKNLAIQRTYDRPQIFHAKAFATETQPPPPDALASYLQNKADTERVEISGFSLGAKHYDCVPSRFRLPNRTRKFTNFHQEKKPGI